MNAQSWFLGTREIVLLGQNVNSYGQDQSGLEITFDRLLYLVGELPGLERLRFTTSHPKDIGFQVIKAFSEIPALCPHLHLPLQSGSNRVLKDMGRRYTREKYLEIVESLRAVCPDLALTTDLIVGFPGETEDDFALTLEMLDLVGFDSAFSFKYSDRPGVRAAGMHPKVPEEIKAARLEELQQLQSKWTRIKLAQRVGRTESVLMEDTSKKKGPEGTESWSGRDPGGRVVHLPLPPGQDYARQLLRVKIVRAHKHSLTGEVIQC